jgi:hypothetical protein
MLTVITDFIKLNLGVMIDVEQRQEVIQPQGF